LNSSNRVHSTFTSAEGSGIDVATKDSKRGLFYSITADIDNNNMVRGNSSMLAKDAAKGESRVFRLEQKDISASA